LSRIQKHLKMANSDRTLEQIIRYLKGLLSNRDRHHLEKEMMQDTFDDEAFDGLNQLTGEELEADMGKLTGMLNRRTQQRKTFILPTFRRIAAALVILIGIGTVLFFLLRKPVPEFITQDLQREIPKTTLPEKSPGQSHETLQNQGEKLTSTPSRSLADKSFDKGDAITEVPIEMDEIATIPDQKDFESANKMESMASASAGLSVQDSIEPFYITGRIVGADHKALAGVSIMEKGKNKEGTLSDINGYFKLSVNDNKSPLTVSRFGYEPVEVTTSEVTGRDITLVADPMELSEMVVIGYGSAKKDKTTASNRKISSDTLITEIQGPFDLSKPVPPGGSLKAFEKWVEDRIVFDRFNDQQGDYNIPVRLTIRKDGTIQNIRVGKEIPSIIAKEYSRVIIQSPLWQPAQNNEIPVDAEVEIIFTLMIR
jgi:hypothetical protein